MRVYRGHWIGLWNPYVVVIVKRWIGIYWYFNVASSWVTRTVILRLTGKWPEFYIVDEDSWRRMCRP